MTRGDRVRVYPHGSPDQAAIGVVMMISENQLSIAVAFEEKPLFVSIEEGFFVGPYGIVMLAARYATPEGPIGPWVELDGRGQYEIEEVA